MSSMKFIYRYKSEGDAQDHAAELRAEGFGTDVRRVHGKRKPNFAPMFEVWRTNEGGTK